VGLLVATVVTLLQAPTYRADASIVLVRAGQPPGSDPGLAQATDTAAELFDSRAVAEAAIRNLTLEETPASAEEEESPRSGVAVSLWARSSVSARLRPRDRAGAPAAGSAAARRCPGRLGSRVGLGRRG
jgi:uncharacterized protein involved in exopolysaccharide biosynthesis